MAKRHWLRNGNIACPTKATSDARLYGITAERFVARFKTDPDLFCTLCAKAARLALAAESAPKPDPRSDSERYADLRKLVEAWQQWQRDHKYNTADAPERLMDWSHR